LDVELTDRFGVPVKPREWFLVPLEVIEEAIEKIKEGTIDQFRYDLETARVISHPKPSMMEPISQPSPSTN
jgi:predicted nucleotidyltransferase